MTDTKTETMHTPDFIDIVFDGPPGHNAGRFVEVEDANGASIKYGEWVQRTDGYWALRIPNPLSGISNPSAIKGLVELAERVSNLNPNAGEIGEGMLRRLVDEATDALSALHTPE